MGKEGGGPLPAVHHTGIRGAVALIAQLADDGGWGSTTAVAHPATLFAFGHASVAWLSAQKRVAQQAERARLRARRLGQER
jgi:hypothetical protein